MFHLKISHAQCSSVAGILAACLSHGVTTFPLSPQGVLSHQSHMDGLPVFFSRLSSKTYHVMDGRTACAVRSISHRL